MLSLLPVCVCGFFIENQVSMCMYLISAFQLIPWWTCLFLGLYHAVFIFVALYHNLKLGIIRPAVVLFFFRIVLAILVWCFWLFCFCVFPYKLRIVLSISVDNCIIKTKFLNTSFQKSLKCFKPKLTKMLNAILLFKNMCMSVLLACTYEIYICSFYIGWERAEDEVDW